MSGLVLSKDEGRVRILTLNRPEQRNALSAALRLELIANLHEAENDASVGAIVITGAGSAFAAGADLGELAARTSEQQAAFLQPPHIYSVIEGLRKPVIAAINGDALGAGLELATACDWRACSAAARLGQPEISFGLIPGGGGTQRLVRLIGRSHAGRLVFTGHAVDGAEAQILGLVDIVLSPETVLPSAVAMASRMAAQDPVAVAAAKRALHAAVTVDYQRGLAMEVDEFVSLHAREESKRRVQAFLSKAAVPRPPRT
ncbi:MAG: enoyl-CoA hydratase-related protein [bacterium]